MAPAQQDRDQLVQFFCASGIITRPQAEEMAAAFVPKSIAKHSFLIEAGQMGDTYLFLETGFLRSYAIDPKGREVSTAFHAPGAVVFEVGSFFKQIPAKEYIQALDHCSGWAINFSQLNHFFHARPEFREFGRSILVNSLINAKARMLSMITDTAEERYAMLLQRNPELFQHAALKHIASYLGVTDTSLSRIRKEMAEK